MHIKNARLIRHRIYAIKHLVGGRQPESIRLVLVDRLPQPDEPELAEAAQQTGLLGPGIVGLTLGFAIFIVTGHETVRLISHECRHVYQYEQYGSIEAFLPIYLEQIAIHGYSDAPLEVEARRHEILRGEFPGFS